MKRRIISLMLAAVMCLTLFAGCTDTGSEEETSAQGEAPEHEPITIMDAQRDYGAFIELVHQKYPEINIEVIPYRGRNMSAYCKQQLETGIIPDIYSTTQAWDAEYQEKYLIDLSQYAVSEQYQKARLDAYKTDNGLYLLPFDYTITGMLVNRTLLDNNGISVPTSFEELRDVCIPALNEKGIKISETLLDLPGSAFQYFFDITSTMYMNTVQGRQWRDGFADTDSDTFASDNEDLAACAAYFQQWIDCGMLSKDEKSGSYTDVLESFLNGNTAFLIGTVKQFTQNEDGTGDQYELMPFLSQDGTNNTYITSPVRLYGLSKELEESGNEQKLEDALHVLEVLSTNEGYLALSGESSTNMCSIRNFEITEDSPYYEASVQVGNGYAMNLVYTGWDNYLVPFGEAVSQWIGKECTGEDAYKKLDDTKLELRESGTTYYAEVTETLDTVQAAQLSGQMFMEATGADAALISYNVYDPSVHALMENSYGANGQILPGMLSEEYITIFLPTGWYDTLLTISKTGSEIKAMAEEGADTRGTGFHYPYVFMTADGEELEDDETYTVVICGYNKDEKETIGLTDTGIVGLDAAKEYLLKTGKVSSSTLDDSLVISGLK